MPKATRREYRIGHGSRFTRTDSMSLQQPQEQIDALSSDCAWDECQRPRFFDMPVCQGHALIIYGRVKQALDASLDETPELPQRPGFVYYLMVGPSTVKIGTTTKLRQRIAALRTDLQYVVAVERGDRDVERQRHQEFAAERIGCREDFRLSERLKAHIEALQPHRDQLVAEAS